MNSQTQAILATDKRIDGKAISAQVLSEVAEQVGQLQAQGVHPCLAVVLVGDDPASQVYVKNKLLRAAEVGILSVEHYLPAQTSAETLLSLIETLNEDAKVHGILVQLPLPQGIDEIQVLEAIKPIKDVDGFHSSNVGGLSQGRSVLQPCTPSGCMRLLNQVRADLSGMHAVVVGRSNIVGKPMAALLLQANCTVTLVHSKSRDIKSLCQMADILVAAVGRPEMIKQDWLKPGAIVIDVGINRVEKEGRSRLVGDVDYADVLDKVEAITPVPGGVGPMTIAMLMSNTLAAAQKQHKLLSISAIDG
ncbi:bifunctional methylenetetrahydrofolate dehydrogenase/methenyltetrahydrofolate cyclohydrolase FolD [Nitrincola tibetensis]|uniref:Bifunctional protein FolD n=1 Tax=Nitrincola tibetensis TaxID=2219697 RepID=A0A364NIS7_9GAMM|nr:bifunctional methylenetetrahydrofolate dehydrogenase/methenyltetrahydrofolate cyclohydrolase FolD [Nitrincola tibetensis]RAU16941.1 bifunctional methylenetetrahydrofolate dehydrogenase/methenyltetrahydrofolate cyclohydrolase FolD [Nitrincola tibetensis]